MTRDIRTPDGGCRYPIAPLLARDGVSWEFLSEDTAELTAEQVAGLDSVIVFGARVSAATLAGPEPPLVFARLGVGYDKVDVAACTEHGVLVTITPDALRRPMAAGAMAFVLALSHSLVAKDREVRAGAWDPFAFIGRGLTGRTLGVLGLGNIGRDLVSLAAPFGLRRIAFDVANTPAPDVEMVDLETVLRESDFLCVTLPLTPATHHFLDAERLSKMKRGAFLINVSRGPIVDQRALAAALMGGHLAGAGLDVFEREPIDPDDPLLHLDNVIVTPHAIGLTDQLFADSARSACESILAIAERRVPTYLVNPEALEHPRLQARLNS